MKYPTGIGTPFTSNTQVRLYTQTMRSDWTVEQLWNWVKAQPLYKDMSKDVFDGIVGWTENEGYWGQSLYGSYLCACCGVNHYIQGKPNNYDEWASSSHMNLPDWAYPKNDILSYGQNPSIDALKSVTIAFANPNPEMEKFYGEASWSDDNPPPWEYLNYSPLCYDYRVDPPIKIWAIIATAWSITTTGSGVRSWTEQDVPTPSPTPTKRRKMPLMFYLKRKIRIK